MTHFTERYFQHISIQRLFCSNWRNFKESAHSLDFRLNKLRLYRNNYLTWLQIDSFQFIFILQFKSFSHETKYTCSLSVHFVQISHWHHEPLNSVMQDSCVLLRLAYKPFAADFWSSLSWYFTHLLNSCHAQPPVSSNERIFMWLTFFN